jgi:O-antigen/teichoic acid export membrane protein
MSYSQQVVRSFLWHGGGQIAGQAISWVATIVVIRLLSPADYGLMAMANVFLGFFLLIADLGFGAAAVQAKALEREQLRQLLGIVLVTNAGGCVLTLAAAPVVAAFFGEPRLTAVVMVLSVNFVLLAASVLPQSQLLRELDFRAKARADILATVLAAVTGLVMAWAGLGVWALVGNSLVMHGVRAVAYNALRPVALAPAFSWEAVTRLAQFGALVTVDRLLFFLHGNADAVIGGRVLGKEALGLYAVALSLAAIPMEKVLPVITQVSFAAFSRIQGEPDRVRRNVLRSVQVVSLVCFPAFLGMAAVAGDLVPLLLGTRWLQLVVPFQLLCLVLPLKAVAVLFTPALFGMGRPGVNVLNTAVAFVTMAAAMLVGVRDGVIGMCAAWVIAYPAVFAVTSWRSLRALGIPYAELLKRCAFAAGASVTMAALVLGLGETLAPHGASALRLSALVGIGVLLYAGLVLLFQRGAVRELLAAARD